MSIKRLYIMRHAAAVEGERNDQGRGITEEGKRQIEIMGDFMVRQAGHVDAVFCSGYRRAKQTAVPMAKALGAEAPKELESLEPDGKSKQAWRDIQDEAGDADDVLIVTHHPLVDKLIERLIGAKTDDVHFHHANIARLDMDEESGHRLRWWVDPKLVEQGAPEPVVIECGLAAGSMEALDGAIELTDAVLGVLNVNESLKSEKHASQIRPLRARVKAVAAGYFRRQVKAIVKEIKPNIQNALDSSAEAHSERSRRIARQILPETLQPLKFQLTQDEADEIQAAIRAAILAAAVQMAVEIRSKAKLAETVLEGYLRRLSLSRLTGDWSSTTLDQLRNGIAEAVESGATADGIVAAIQQVSADFADSRAEMIAQTEVNDAYNFGRKEMARELGMDQKRWSPDGTEACEECMEQVEAGWIDLDDDFPGGVEAPTLHPRCDCGLDFRKGEFEDLPTD